MDFEWDLANIGHLGWHDVEPYEAEDAFFKSVSTTTEQEVDGELRYRFDGLTDNGRPLTVVFTLRGDRVRVITAFEP